MRDGAM